MQRVKIYIFINIGFSLRASVPFEFELALAVCLLGSDQIWRWRRHMLNAWIACVCGLLSANHRIKIHFQFNKIAQIYLNICPSEN